MKIHNVSFTTPARTIDGSWLTTVTEALARHIEPDQYPLRFAIVAVTGLLLPSLLPPLATGKSYSAQGRCQ